MTELSTHDTHSLVFHPRPRFGKTTRDHASGAWKRRLQNQQLRDEWYKDTSPNKRFPTATCNGHRHRQKAGKVVK